MHRLSVAEIADLVDELDDSDVDPDYTERMKTWTAQSASRRRMAAFPWD